MANTNEGKSVTPATTRVLRPRKSSVNYAEVVVPEDAVEHQIAKKRKVMNAEDSESVAKSARAIPKSGMGNIGATSGSSTRILRSSTASKEVVVKEYAKAETNEGYCSLATEFTSPESTGKRLTRSATKAQVATKTK